MNERRDDEARDGAADDLFVDHCLQQQLGDARPKDLADVIARAPAARLAQAAARVDAAALRGAGARRLAPRVWAAAAALLLVAATLLWLGGAFERAPRASAKERAQALLDDFHAVMPHYPVMLRDAWRRERLAPRALPVIHAILALQREPDSGRPFGDRISEFEAYAAMFGDERTLADLRARAERGDVEAEAMLASARVAASDGEPRADAIDDLVRCLMRQPEIAPRVSRCMVVAELTLGEADRLAAVVPQPYVRDALRLAAERAASGPRRLIGRTLAYRGSELHGEPFDLQALRGRVVLVCFWASWCRPSLFELERVRAAQRRHPELAVVAVSCDHDVRALRDYVAEHDDRGWLQVFDRARPGWHELAIACGLHAVPCTMLLDRDGVVRDVDVGADVDLLSDAAAHLLGR